MNRRSRVATAYLGILPSLGYITRATIPVAAARSSRWQRPRRHRTAELALLWAASSSRSYTYRLGRYKAWYESPAHREVREHRFRGADYRAVIVENV